MAGTKSAVVVSDGLSYKIPGQDKPGPRETYAMLAATRGDTIELDEKDYDRFKSLGAVVDEGTSEAAAAHNPKVGGGDPYGAVRISGEGHNLPVDKLRSEAKRLGLTISRDDDLDDGAGAVSGEAPGDDELNLADSGKLYKQLNAAQMKALAERHGITVETTDTKQTIADKIVEKASA